MCEECSVGGTELQCPRCRALSGVTFPFTRDNHDFSRLWDCAFEAWKREWAMLSVGFVILGAASMGAGLIGNVFSSILQAIVGKKDVAAMVAVLVLGQLFIYMIQQIAVGAAQLGLYRLMFDVMRGGKADIGRMFTQLSKIPAFIGQWLIVALMVGLPVLLYFGIALVVAVKVGHVELPSFDLSHNTDELARDWVEALGHIAPVLAVSFLLVIVPLLWVTLALAFVPLEIVYGNAGAWESITRAFALARGFRLSIFGYSFVGGLVVLVGLLACCVGVIPAAALSQMLMVSLYLAVRNGSGLPPPPEP
jgi:hypothetical protein